jgi:cytochrome bd ubiquinol oxidase subunit I
MTFDPVFLSRLQFAWVIAWHILLPAFTVGLASYIAVLEGLYLYNNNPIYRRISAMWIKVFSVSFSMGVVSGVIMPFQLGTNWSRFSDATSNVLAPLFAYEGLTAFFLEAAFLGILLFGRTRVPKPIYFASALIVAFGTALSSFWILSVNSWMQTPAGFEIIDGRFFPVDWSAIIFNPSFPYRLAHTVNAFYVTTALVVAGVGAYLIKRGKSKPEGQVMMSMAFWLLTVFVPLQVVIGDLHGVNTLQYQPAKLAAIEGLWETSSSVPAVLFAIPNQKLEKNDYEIDAPIKGLASLYLTHSWIGEVKGLRDFPIDERPPVAVIFWSFRVMVGLGFLILGLVISSWILRWRGLLYHNRFINVVMCAAPLGFMAVIAGWITTEVGRQPWTVYGLYRTAQSVSPSITSNQVLFSLASYIAVYLLMYPAGVMVMARIIKKGPLDEANSPPIQAGKPEAPTKSISPSSTPS